MTFFCLPFGGVTCEKSLKQGLGFQKIVSVMCHPFLGRSQFKQPNMTTSGKSVLVEFLEKHDKELFAFLQQEENLDHFDRILVLDADNGMMGLHDPDAFLKTQESINKGMAKNLKTLIDKRQSSQQCVVIFKAGTGMWNSLIRFGVTKTPPDDASRKADWELFQRMNGNPTDPSALAQLLAAFDKIAPPVTS